jgi:tyrosinase
VLANIVQINGTVAREDQYQTLTVEVQEEIVTLGRNIYELPSYGAKTMHPEITQGKAGGYLQKKKL